jgi:hypothetical protein
MTRWRLDAGQIEVVDDDVAAVLRRKTPVQRLAMVFAANRTMRLRLTAALRAWHPDGSNEAVRREVARRMTRGTG